MTFDHVLIAVNTAASLLVVWGAICALNLMSERTGWYLRVAHVFVGAGAGAMLLSPGYLSRIPTLPEVLLIAGVAILVSVGRLRGRYYRLIQHHS